MIDEANQLKQHLQGIVWMLETLDEAEKSCCGITLAQADALEAVGRAGEISLNDLASRLNLDKSTLSRTVSNLVTQGFCERDVHPDDRRYIAIRLTESGRALFSRIDGDLDAYFGQIYQALPAGKRSQVVESAEILLAAIRTSGCCSQGRCGT